MPHTSRSTLQQRPRTPTTSRQFSTANVTDLPGGAQSGAGDIRSREPGGGIRLPPFPGSRPAGPRPGGVLPPTQPLPPPAAVAPFVPQQVPQVPQGATFGSADPRIQALIAQIAQRTDSGATSSAGTPFDPGSGQAAPFQADPRIQTLISQIQGGGGGPVLEETGAEQRAVLEQLIAQLGGGDFDFDASQDPEAIAFRVATERARAASQNAAAERLGADPTNTGGFDVDTRALREQAGESVGRFAAGRASQRRGEVLGERISAANLGLANLGQIQAGDVARFNAASSAAAGGQNRQLAALQALIGQDESRRLSTEATASRGQADRQFGASLRSRETEDARRATAASRSEGLASSQALLQQLLAEQARTQRGTAQAGQQTFENEIAAGQFASGQQQAGVADQRQAADTALQRLLLDQGLARQGRQDVLSDRGTGLSNELLALQVQAEEERQRRGGARGGGGGLPVRVPRAAVNPRISASNPRV